MPDMKLKSFLYEFDAGPFPHEEELSGEWHTGNCRRAVQYFLFCVHSVFLKPEEVLLPEAYHNTGMFVTKGDKPLDLDLLQRGDVIYAERIRNRKGELLSKRGALRGSEVYILHLHTALWHGEPTKEIWHASTIMGASGFWPLARFLHFYNPIAVKRFIAGPVLSRAPLSSRSEVLPKGRRS